ncbi:FecR family protein [Pedobacter miscanthi]|uniref:FecR family protein n=1 Tax=Pedobacter miscanthi TaxID=2259170 RepID=UPI00292CE942|nr:FecR domain-containing protein [Pedobacter miscanthi]
MKPDEIRFLIKKYNSQTATPDEKKLVEQWYDGVDGDDLNEDQFNKKALKKLIFENVTSAVEHKKAYVQPKKVKLYHSLFFKAAVLVLALLAGTYVYLKQSEGIIKVTNVPKTPKTKIMPGGNNAVLLLADGSQIALNSASDGHIADQSGVQVIKTKSGELLYRFVGNTNTTAINTISTPRGGQYHLILVDGTQVWLNANSSVKFPTAFNGNERRVEVSGEVYFEVAKNKTKPFIVHTDQSDIKVLGTHFNVNTYDDEAAQRTTLLEGSIQLTRGNQKVLLTPGQQASINRKAEAIKIKEIADLDAVIAWKNGYFQFEKSDLQSVMRQVSRWYNTSVDYNGTIPTKEYSGKIPRNVNVSKLIEMLSYSGIHCEIKNNQIIVNPK